MTLDARAAPRPGHDAAYAENVEAVLAAQPFMRWLGVRMTAVAPGEVELRALIRPDFLQHTGVVHGGVVGSLADNAAGMAAGTLVPQGVAPVTAECRVSYLRPAKGEEIIARGRVLKPGRAVLHTGCDVFVLAAGTEILVASALATMVPVPFETGG